MTKKEKNSIGQYSNESDLVKVLNALHESKDDVMEASRKLDVHGRSVRIWRDRAIAEGRYDPNAKNRVRPSLSEVAGSLRERQLEKENRRLETELAQANEQMAEAIGIAEAFNKNSRKPDPSFLKDFDASDTRGVPIAMLSDVHHGEFVDPSQINGINAFDKDISKARLQEFFSKIVHLTNGHLSPKNKVPGMVLCLGGDMTSGEIHGELQQTNDLTTPQAVLDLHDIVADGLALLADEFGKVFVPCVAGNHGRMTHKPQAKNRAFLNFDWMLYQFLNRTFRNDKRIVFSIPDGPDCLFNVYGQKYLLTHGDQFRGGDGIIGPLGPLTRGGMKKSARNSAVGQGFDVMLFGHFHQCITTRGLMGNGSVKGYDEYAAANNFAVELPTQRLWLDTPQHPRSHVMDIVLTEGTNANGGDGKGWVWTD